MPIANYTAACHLDERHSYKVSAGRRIAMSSPKMTTSVSNDNSSNNNKRKSINHEQTRGGIIPKSRPDIAARNSLGGEAALIQRGMKQRKNKKKQARDRELTRFASRHSF